MGINIGYARWPTEGHDLAHRNAVAALEVAPERIYVDHGLTGTKGAARPSRGAWSLTRRRRLGHRQALVTPTEHWALVQRHRC